MNLEKLVTVKQLAEASPAFSEASLRWMIFNARTNGLNRALVKVGSRVLIDLGEFGFWLEDQRIGNPPHRDTCEKVA
jgi:hypothetical protein